MSCVVRVRDLTKIYPGKSSWFTNKTTNPFIAVDHISFDVQEGEILGFLGPNGAGKTTTIQMMLSVLTPTSGSIEYFGKNFFTHRSEILQNVGFASTYVKMPGNLTLYENLNTFGRIYGMSHAQRIDAISKNLKFFDLWDIRHRKTRMLSAGESTRAMLCKAFLSNPKVVLLDEPTAALDPDVAHEVRKFVREQQEKHGVSFLFTSHNMAEVTELCSRVLVLKRGTIIADNTPEELAESVAQTTIELSVKEDQITACIAYLEQQNMHYSKDGFYFEIPIKEEAIAPFLHQLSIQGIEFTSISIDKPKLEDYFLQLSKSQRGAS